LTTFFIEERIGKSVLLTTFSASTHLPVNPFPPSALPGFNGTMSWSDYLSLILNPRFLGYE